MRVGTIGQSAIPVGGREIEIRIERREAPSGACRVWITGPDDRRAEGTFTSPFSPSEVEQALGWIDRGAAGTGPDSSQVRAFGERLFTALFQGAVAGVYVASQDASSQPRLRLVVDDPEAARIPWELLVDPVSGAQLAVRSRLVRGITTQGGARRVAVEAPLRILIVGSAPSDLPGLTSQLEARDIERALSPVSAQGRIEYEVLEHATINGLLNALREATARGRPFHVLHWIGHGALDATLGSNVLLFEDDDGKSDAIDGAGLASVLVDSDIRLVFLNACHSAAPSGRTFDAPTADTARAMAEVLLTIGIPAVIGMRVEVLDDTAREFAVEFYAALADGRGIDDAVLDSRRLVIGVERERALEIGVPVLYLRSGASALLASVTPLSWWQRPLMRFRRLTPIGKVAVFVFAVLAALIIERSAEAGWNALQGPPRMGGDFNVAVADFAGRDAQGRPAFSQHASDLSTNLATRLQEELAPLPDIIQVRKYERQIAGSTTEERAQEAQAFAEQVNADVVVYGWLDASRTSLQPEFFVREGRLDGAEELVGPFQLGSGIRSDAPIDELGAAKSWMRQILETRAYALSEVVVGLSYFQLSQFETAQSHFDAAIATGGWPESDGKEVLLLFRGMTALVLGKSDEAEWWFAAALALNADFVRARVGLAEVTLQRAFQYCRRTEDLIGATELRAAHDEYQRVLASRPADATDVLTLKAHLGVARAAMCLSQAGIENGWGEAVREANVVVAAHQQDEENDVLAYLASHAHGVLAVAALTGAIDVAQQVSPQEQALEHARTAVELSDRNDLKATYSLLVADVLALLGRSDEAHQACVDANTYAQRVLRECAPPAGPPGSPHAAKEVVG